ncbi:MAG: hypothetical protein ACJ76N_22980 [Thermoanaerobaculia bacterium]
MSYRVRVLSSYIYAGDEGPFSAMGRRNRWFHGFVAGLVHRGSSLNELALDFVQLPREEGAVEACHRECLEQGVRLTICAGTDSIVRWARVCRDIPSLYFGAHPENNGLELIRQPNVAGVRLNLPLIWSYRNFSLLGELVPGLEAVYIPVNLRSEFAFPNVRAAYEEHRRRQAGFWIPGESGWIGHRSVQFLAERLGCRYHEGPFESVDELLAGLGEARVERSAFVGFNDTVLMEHAANRFREWCAENGAALFWVNNWPIVAAGGVADFSSHFEEVGKLLAAQALAILREGRPPAEAGFEEDPGERLALNLRRCAELSLAVSGELRARFHTVQE